MAENTATPEKSIEEAISKITIAGLTTSSEKQIYEDKKQALFKFLKSQSAEAQAQIADSFQERDYKMLLQVRETEDRQSVVEQLLQYKNITKHLQELDKNLKTSTIFEGVGSVGLKMNIAGVKDDNIQTVMSHLSIESADMKHIGSILSFSVQNVQWLNEPKAIGTLTGSQETQNKPEDMSPKQQAKHYEPKDERSSRRSITHFFRTQNKEQPKPNASDKAPSDSLLDRAKRFFKLK